MEYRYEEYQQQQVYYAIRLFLLFVQFHMVENQISIQVLMDAWQVEIVATLSTAT